MELFKNMSASRRQSALAVMMLAVLLVATAAAWVLVWRSRGEAVPGEQWYLITDGDGNPQGWEVFQRQSDGASGASGYHVRSGPAAGREPMWSKWRLNAGATEGSYISSVTSRPKGYPYPVTQTTYIQYTHPDVRIHQTTTDAGGLNEQRSTGPTKAPAGYIPEGRFRDVIADAARTQTPATRAMVIDSRFRMVPVALAPRGAGEEEVQGKTLSVAMVEVTFGASGGDGSTVYSVDDRGRIVAERLVRAGRIYSISSLSTFADVSRQFPAAHAIRARALAERKLP